MANRRARTARDQASDVIAARIRRRIAGARTALRVVDTRDASGRAGGLSFAIRRRSATAVAPHATAFVTSAQRARAAQTEGTVNAIGILSAFRACGTDRTRQTEWIPRYRHAIDDHGFERKAIDARIATTRGRIVFRQRGHAPADCQVADAAFAFRIGRAFDTQGFAIGLDGFAFHLRAELAVRAAIARRSRT